MSDCYTTRSAVTSYDIWIFSKADPPATFNHNAKGRTNLKYRFEGHKERIWGFVFLHDNIHVVSSSLDGTMCKWNCEGERIFALALSPDGKIIACGMQNGSVQR
jgi:WD40 repeat protein